MLMKLTRLAVFSIIGLLLGSLVPQPAMANVNHIHPHLLSSLTVNGQVPLQKNGAAGFDPYFSDYVFNISGPLSAVELAWGLDSDPDANVELSLVRYLTLGGHTIPGNSYLPEPPASLSTAQSFTIPKDDLCHVSDPDSEICHDPPAYALILLTVNHGSVSFDYRLELAWPDSTDIFFSQMFDPGPMIGPVPSTIVVNGPQFLKFPTPSLTDATGGQAYGWLSTRDDFIPVGGYGFVDRMETYTAFSMNYADPDDFTLFIQSMSDSSFAPGRPGAAYRSLNMYGNAAEYFEFEVSIHGQVTTWDPWIYGHYQVELKSWPDGATLDTLDSRTSARNILSTGTACNSVDSQSCSNIFTLSVSVTSANQVYTNSAEYLLLRQTDITLQPQISVHWSDDTTEVTGLDWQGWFEIPNVIDAQATPSGKTLAGFTTTPGGLAVEYLPGETVPVFENLDLYPVWQSYLLPGRIDIFGSSIQFAPCSNDPNENCLNLITGGASAVEHQSRFSDTDMFFITLDVSEEFLFNNPEDDHLQTISIDAPTGTTTVTAFGSMDYRLADFQNATFGGDRYISDTGISLADTDVCTEWSGCHEAFFLSMNNRVDFDSWTGIVYFVLDFNPSQRHNISYVDNEFMPLIPQPASVQQPLPRGWLDFQAQAQPSVEGFSFNGWGSYNSPERYLTGPMFPILQDDTIFPWMAYVLNIWSEGVQIDTRTIDFPVFPSELTIPTSVNGDAFVGWSLTDGGTPIADPANYMIQGPGPVNLYAVFGEDSPYPNSFEVFGNSMEFGPCLNDQSTVCASVTTGQQAPVVYPSASLTLPAGGVGGSIDLFLVTLEVSNTFSPVNSSDDNQQRVDYSFPAGTQGSVTLGSLDHRIPDFLDLEVLLADGGQVISDEILCSDNGCHEAIFLRIESNSDTRSWAGVVAIVLDFNPTQRYNLTYLNSDFTPRSEQPASVRNPLPRGWHEIDPGFEPATEGFTFLGMDTDSNTEVFLPIPFLPVLQNENIFPILEFELSLWSEGVKVSELNPNSPVSLNELTVPTSSMGHTFVGWSLADGGDLIESPGTFMIQGPGPVNVYAVFQAPSFEIRLSVEGELTTVTTTNTTNLAALTTPVHSQNHVFLGWSLTDGGPLITDSSFTLAAPGPHTLYAVFEQPQAEPEQTPGSEPEQTPTSPESSAPSQPLPVTSEAKEEQSSIFSGPSGGELSLSIRKVNENQVKFYAEFPQVGQKIQFMVQRADGSWRERGWLRVEESDLSVTGEYQGLQNGRFFIRTVTLRDGTNRLRVLVDGVIVGGTKTFQQ